jgi:hypothetical protein
MLETWPPAMVIGLIATVTWAIVALAVVFPFVRAWSRRIENRNAPAMPADVTARLARIEAAVDSIALEVERISESQRFLTKLQAERVPIAPGGAPAERQH